MTTDEGISMLYVVTAETRDGALEQYDHVVTVKEGIFLQLTTIEGGMQLLNPAEYKRVEITPSGAGSAAYFDHFTKDALQ